MWFTIEKNNKDLAEVTKQEQNRKRPVTGREQWGTNYSIDYTLSKFLDNAGLSDDADLVITCLKESRTYQKCLEKAVTAKINQKRLEIRKLEEDFLL